MNTFDALTPNFWDCECETRYVHHFSIPHCPRCGALRENQPDSHEEEVAEHLQEIFAELFQHFTLALVQLSAIERQYAKGPMTEILANGQPEKLPPWAASVLADRMAFLKALQREAEASSQNPETEDGWLEAAWEDRFSTPETGDW